MIVYHQNHVGGYVGGHRYYAPFIWQLPQHNAAGVEDVTLVAIRDRTHPRYWVRRIQ